MGTFVYVEFMFGLKIRWKQEQPKVRIQVQINDE